MSENVWLYVTTGLLIVAFFYLLKLPGDENEEKDPTLISTGIYLKEEMGSDRRSFQIFVDEKQYKIFKTHMLKNLYAPDL